MSNGFMVKLAMEMDQREIVTGDMILDGWFSGDFIIGIDVKVQFKDQYELMKLVLIEENGDMHYKSTRDDQFIIKVPFGYKSVQEYPSNNRNDPWIVIIVDGHANQYKPNKNQQNRNDQNQNRNRDNRKRW